MNLGYSHSDKTQNSFTAYLLVALNRNAYAFIQKQNQALCETDIIDDIEDKNVSEELFLNNLSWVDQLENEQLVTLISKLPQKTREILYMKIFDELSLPQIAAKLGIHTQKVSAIYYRAITKLKKSLGDVEK